jgi:hypothetical protein
LLTHFTSSSTDGCTYVSSSDSSSSSSDSFGSCYVEMRNKFYLTMNSLS